MSITNCFRSSHLCTRYPVIITVPIQNLNDNHENNDNKNLNENNPNDENDIYFKELMFTIRFGYVYNVKSRFFHYILFKIYIDSSKVDAKKPRTE